MDTNNHSFFNKIKDKNKLIWIIVGIVIIAVGIIKLYPQDVKLKFVFGNEINQEDIVFNYTGEVQVYGPSWYFPNVVFYKTQINGLKNINVEFNNSCVENIESIQLFVNNITLDTINVSDLTVIENGYLLDFSQINYSKNLLFIRIGYIVLGVLILALYIYLILKIRKINNYFGCIIGLLASFVLLFYKNWNIDFTATLLIGAVLIIFCSIMYKKMDAKPLEILLWGVIAEICIYFSVYKLSAYLTVDEPRAILEQINIETDAMRHFLYYGNARTNYLIMGTFWKVMPFDLSQVSLEEQMYIAKLVHWFIGVLLLLYISCLVVKIVGLFNNNQRKSFIFASTFIFILVNPLVLMALKNYNYDLFSMLFGIISILLSYICIKSTNIRSGVASVFFGALAAQEKISAVPVLLVSMIILVGALTWKKQKRFAICTIIASLACTLFVGAIFLINVIYVIYILRTGISPNINIKDIYMPIIAIVSQMNKSFGNTDYYLGIVMILLISIVVMLGVFIIRGILCLINKDKNNVAKIIWNKRKWVFIVGMSVALLIGIVGTYLQPYAYMSGVYKVEGDSYVGESVTALNFHFNSGSYIQNKAKYIVAMFEMVYNSMPTVCLILLILLIYIYIRKKNSERDDFILELFLLLYGVGAVTAYGIINLTPLNRYLNLYVLAESVFVLILFWKNISSIKFFRDSMMYIITVLAMVEVLVFGPSYTSYWPIWNVMPYFETENVPGRMLLNWQGGWGEHMALSCEKIQDWCLKNGIPYEKVKIYINYNGTWLENVNNLTVKRMPGYRASASNEYPEIDYSNFNLEEGTFYVFSKWGLRWASTSYGLPEDIEPVMTISYRKATECWIYTGEQLKEYFKEQFN